MKFGYQDHAVAFLKRVDRGILALDMRMGKSRCALLAAGDGPILIVCPVPVKIHWMREVQKWRPDLADSIQIIDRKTDRPVRGRAVTIIPYSIVSHFVEKGLVHKPEYFILDEFHYCKSLKTARSKACMKLLRSVHRAALLSGTPMPNRPMEWYPVLKELKVFKNKAHFGLEYCAGWMSPWGWDYTGASNLEELAEKIAPVMFRRTASDLKEYLPPILPPVVVELDLPLDQREKDFNALEIARSPHSIAFEAVSDILHMNGVRKLPLAIDHIKDVLHNEDKVIVWAWHRDVVEELALAFLNYKPLVIHGGTKDRQGIIDLFHKDPSHRVIIGNIKAMGVGVEIVAASYNVFVEAPWVPGDLDQAIARAWGPNQSKPVRTDILTIHRSIDAHVLHAILRKQDHIETVVKETPMTDANRMDQLIVAVMEERAEEDGLSIAEYLIKINLLTALDDVSQEAEAEVVEPKKKGKKKVAAKKKPAPVELTLDDVRQALAKVMREQDADRVRFILGEFEADKVSDLTPCQYEAVLAMAAEDD